MKDLTVIVPVHKYDENIAEMLNDAVNSVTEATRKEDEIKILFVGPETVMNKVKEKYPNAEYLINEKTDFISQINKAVEKCGKYFSILEFDDKFLPNWFKNADEYMDIYPDVSVFLPLTEISLFDKKDSGPIGYVNEAVWASSFSDELGFLDLDSLLSYVNFNTTGAIFNTSDFIENGKLKGSIKLTFWYEYLLRCVYNNKKIYVIPKSGYQHFLNRKDSLSDIYNKEMTPEEAEWWIDLAQKDYLFKKERDASHYIYEK